MNPRAALHLDDSEDVLIVEGCVAPADSTALGTRVDEELASKYVTIRSGRPYRSTMNPEVQLWTFTPTTAFTWWEMAMDRTGRRWQWSDSATPSPTPDWRPFQR